MGLVLLKNCNLIDEEGNISSGEDLLVNRLARHQAEEAAKTAPAAGTEAAEAIPETPERAEAPETEEDEPHGGEN